MFYDEMLQKYLIENKAEARMLYFKHPVRSIEEAESAAKVNRNELIKTVIFLDEEIGCIACIVLGTQKVDIKKVKNLLKIKNLKFANAAEVLNLTGYPIGGVPPVGYPGRFFIDPKVMQKKYVISGGGSDKTLLKIVPHEIVRLTNADIVDISQ